MIAVRAARADDFAALASIYNWYVANSHCTFDVEPTTERALASRFDAYRAGAGPHRLFVAEESGVVLGCAYTSSYRAHAAFARTVEASVYVSHAARGKGVGSALYGRLFDAIAGENMHRIVAGVALPNPASIALHKKHGFEEIGVFDEYAMKGDAYVSSVWLQKRLR